MHPEISPRTSLFPTTSGMSGGGLRRLLSAAMRSWQRRKMISTFDAMDDWMLSDIGLRREDIVRVVNSFDEMRTPSLVLPVRREAVGGNEPGIQQPSVQEPCANDTRKAA